MFGFITCKLGFPHSRTQFPWALGYKRLLPPAACFSLPFEPLAAAPVTLPSIPYLLRSSRLFSTPGDSCPQCPPSTQPTSGASGLRLACAQDLGPDLRHPSFLSCSAVTQVPTAAESSLHRNRIQTGLSDRLVFSKSLPHSLWGPDSAVLVWVGGVHPPDWVGSRESLAQ